MTSAPFGLRSRSAWSGLAAAVGRALAEHDWPEAGREVELHFDSGVRQSLRVRVRFMLRERVVSEVAGEAWLTNEWFRFGASSLLNDLILQRQRMRTGAYSGGDYVADDSPSLY